MKKKFKNTILFILFSFWGMVGHAQLYPVQVTPIFNSPYSVKIGDYATSMDTKMQLLINPNDVTINNRQVRLKLFIQGNGINAQSSDYLQGQSPIYINGGELKTVTNTDISALFRLENLQGITAAQYANPLPEGMYTFCFEMYDFITNQKISQKSCASLYIILNDPPLLNTPQNKELIAYTEFPNILFTWTPRQINATNVSYKFEIKQLFDETLDPQIGFQMAPLLYDETLYGTALLYNLSKPILTPGLWYAWRVRAISTSGLSENAVFKNDGYSEVYSFKYTGLCSAPSFVLSESQSTKSVKITWQGLPEHTRYQVQYRKEGVRNAQWFSNYSQNTQGLITDLEAGVSYEFRVGSSCEAATDGLQTFTYSGINTFTTPTDSKGVAAYNCGIVPEISITNQKPLTNLIQSETFTAGDFPVTILELQGENSPYSGRGYIIVPYLADTKIAVEFNSIVVNTDYQLIRGVVQTSYNPDWGSIVDAEPLVDVMGELTQETKDIIKDLFTSENDNSSGIVTEKENNTNPIVNNGVAITNTNLSNTNTTTNTTTTETNATNSTNANIENTNTTNTSDTSISNAIEVSNEESTDVFIVYENKNYKSGDVIEVEYNKDKPYFAFLLKNYPNEATINWRVLKGGTDNTSAYATNETIHDNLGIDMKEMQILDIVANYNNKKIQITIKRKPKDFKLEELYALHNKTRLAKSGEILYLINPPTVTKDVKTVEYSLKLNTKLDKKFLPSNAIQWAFNGEDQYSLFGESKISRKLDEKNDTKTTVNAGSPSSLEKSIDVKWVDEGFKKHNLKFDAGFDLMDNLKELAQKLGVPVYQEKGKYATDNKFSVLADATYTTEFRNKEDSKSRLVYEEKKEIFSATVGAKGSFEKGIPSLSLPTVKKTYLGEDFEFSLGIYFFIEGTSIGQIGHTKYIENWIEEKQKRNRTYKEIGNPSKVIISAKIGLDPRVSIKATDYVSAKVSGKSFAEAQLYVADLYKNEFYSPILTEGFKLKCTPVAFIKIWKFSYDLQWGEYEYQVKW